MRAGIYAGRGGAIGGRAVWKLLFYYGEREIMHEHTEGTDGDNAVFVGAGAVGPWADENGIRGWDGYTEGDARARCPHTGEDGLASLFRYAVAFAKARVNRMYWRGAWNGVLPYGYDAESIAAEAVEELLGIGAIAVGHPNGAKACGNGGGVYSAEHVHAEVERLIRMRVRRLYRRMENWLLRNEWDILPPGRDGELRSVLDEMAGKVRGPDEAMMLAEDDSRLKKLKRDFACSLGKEKELREAFGCICRGAVGEMTGKPGLKPAVVTNFKKRLKLRWRRFEAGNTSGKSSSVERTENVDRSARIAGKLNRHS